MKYTARRVTFWLVAIGVGMLAAPRLYQWFFALMDYLYRRGIEGHWL